MNATSTPKGKQLTGTVVKSAMKDTVTVSVERYVKHPKYKKFMKISKKYLVHNPGNTARIGDRVALQETKPISKRKRFIISETLKAANVQAE